MKLFADNCFNCEYCPEIFQSQEARTCHTVIHFKSKSCLNCKKLLICINNDWYELHATVQCNKERNESNPNTFECIVDNVKVEDSDTPEDSSVRSYHYDSDDVEDDKIIDDQPNLQQLIEVKPLPVITDLDIKTKFRQKIPRKTKSVPKITKNPKLPKIPKQVAVKKEKKSSKTSNDERKPHINRKKIDKATFLDHRPKSTCICDICNKTLGTFSSLRNHIINMHCLSGKNERVSCDECGQTFSTPGNLNSHKKIHLKCKAYVCTYCGRGFNQLHNLKEHTNRHTGETPYQCTICTKAFGRKTNLVAHTRVHTGVKPFKCNIEGCDRDYMFEIDLKRHKYSKHGIFTKKHICPICAKVYPENKLLKKHLESHSTGFT